MDPVSHAVIGRAVTTIWRREPVAVRGVVLATILGALSPDIDFVLMPVGWDIYLRAHAAGTHSLLGAAVTGAGAALLARLIRHPSSWPALCVPAIVAAWTHVAADIVSGARLAPLWPLSYGMPALPLVSMGDPWTIAILLAGAVAMLRAGPRLRRASRFTVLGLMAFLVLKGGLLAVVAGDVRRTPAIDGAVRIFEAEWGSLGGWLLFERSEASLRQWQLHAWRGEPRLVRSVPVTPDSALIARSRRLQAVRNFLAVHELPFAREGPDGYVLWSDLRFCAGSRALVPWPSLPVCALWFGGRFDASGNAVVQEVRVGDWIQRRPP